MIPDGQRMVLTIERAREKVPAAPSSNAHPLGHTHYIATVTPEADGDGMRIAATVLFSGSSHIVARYSLEPHQYRLVEGPRSAGVLCYRGPAKLSHGGHPPSCCGDVCMRETSRVRSGMAYKRTLLANTL